MTQVIELTKKQLELISGTQKQKQELTKLFQEISQKESTIVDLILDSNGVVDQPKDIRFENDTLIVTFPEAEKKAPKKAKAKKGPATKFVEDSYNQG